MKKLVFRQYKDSDITQIKELHRSALEDTNAFAKSGVWDEDLNNIPDVYFRHGEFLVGLLNNRIVAMGAIKKISDSIGEIKRMRVLPELQGKGIGKELLLLLEKRARELGFKTIQLDTTVNQKAAQKLYEKYGYKEIRRETEGWPLEMIFYQKELV